MSGLVCCGLRSLIALEGRRLRLKAEFFGGGLAGVPPPEIDGELAGDGDDGFLSGSAGGLGSA